MNITQIIAIAATVATLTVGNVQAQEVPLIQIDTTNVNFANAASVDQLKSRIEHAARRVCGVGYERDLPSQMKARACYSTTVADAGSKIEQRVANSETKPTSNTLAINTK